MSDPTRMTLPEPVDLIACTADGGRQLCVGASGTLFRIGG